jgi:Uma2 family endonuclease
LQEYVLINSKRQRVECFRRGEEGLWILQSYTSESNKYQLKSINFEGEMSLLYEDVVFE